MSTNYEWDISILTKGSKNMNINFFWRQINKLNNQKKLEDPTLGKKRNFICIQQVIIFSLQENP